MNKYRILKIMQYTEEVIVEAESSREAIEMSGMEEGERNYDDAWYDSEIIEIIEEDEE